MAKNQPTPKMLNAAMQAAARHSVQLPEGYETDFDVCKQFLDTYLVRPTPKALEFAQSLAQELGLEIPDEAITNGKALSHWIDDAKARRPA